MTKIRVREQERELLKDLQTIPDVREMALDDGVLENEDDALSYEKLLQLVIPDDAEVLARPEEEMAWITVHDYRDEVLRLAGENVSAHKVIRHYTELFIEENDIEVELND